MNEHAHHRPRTRRWLFGCFAVIFIIVAMAIGLGGYIALVPTEDSTDALRAKGYPTTLEELEEWYLEPPPGENAAEYYVQAGILLNRSNFEELGALPLFGDGELPTLGIPDSDEMQATIAQFLEHEALAFQLIDEASQFETSRDPTVQVMGGSSVMELFATFRGQRLRTHFYNSLGDTDSTLEQFATLAHMARSVGQTPVPDGLMMVRSSIDFAIAALEDIVNQDELSPQQLELVERVLEQLLPGDRLVRDILATRCRTLALIDSSQSFSFLHGYARKEFLNAADAHFAVAEVGLPGQLDEFRGLIGKKYSWMDTFESLYANGFRLSVAHFYEAETRLNVAKAAIAIQKLRLSGAEIPERFEELEETVREDWPIDPFSGRPLGYNRSGDGFVVYGVGRNFEDDGGQWDQGLDTVFRVLR